MPKLVLKKMDSEETVEILVPEETFNKLVKGKWSVSEVNKNE